MQTSSFGSYAFGDFASNEAELTRLHAQATAAWALEKSRILDAGLTPGMKVLDLACGPGFISRLIAAELGPEGSVLGIDLNDRLLQIAEKTAADWNASAEEPRAGLSFKKADVYDLDLAENSVDFVYARFLFQHLERPLDALAQIRRVLKPGGRFIVADADDALFSLYPEPPALKPLLKTASRAQRRRGGDRQVGRKLPYYLKRAGFTDVATDIVVVSSDDIGLEEFLSVTTRFKVEWLPEGERKEAWEMLDTIGRNAGSETVHAMTGVYAVSGSAPA